MGLERSIQVNSTGVYSATDLRTKQTVNGMLTADRLKKFKAYISSLNYSPNNKIPGAACADCFIYDLEIHRNGKGITIQLSDIDLPDSGLEPLVSELRQILDSSFR